MLSVFPTGAVCSAIFFELASGLSLSPDVTTSGPLALEALPEEHNVGVHTSAGSGAGSPVSRVPGTRSLVLWKISDLRFKVTLRALS